MMIIRVGQFAIFFAVFAKYLLAEKCNCELGWQAAINFDQSSNFKPTWSVDIQQNKTVRCSGVLISNIHILCNLNCIIPTQHHPGDNMNQSNWLTNTKIRLNKKLKYKVNHIFMNELIAILEIDGFITFDQYHQPATLPQLPFHGLTEYLATAYIEEHWTHVTTKIKSAIWNDDICKYLTDYKDENSICLNIEDECPQCNLCKETGTMQPLFNVDQKNRLFLVALPKLCKIAKPMINLYTYQSEIKTAAIYHPIIEFIPWINNVLQQRCFCNNNHPTQDGNNTVIY